LIFIGNRLCKTYYPKAIWAKREQIFFFVLFLYPKETDKSFDSCGETGIRFCEHEPRKKSERKRFGVRAQISGVVELGEDIDLKKEIAQRVNS